jgi:hypothetical protein
LFVFEVLAMPGLRFPTARALFDAFPEVSQKISAAPTEQSPIHFLKALSSADQLPDAVTFCAYLLPRRDAVWWACKSVRALSGQIAPDLAAGLLAAEAWVYEPDDEHRQGALELGTNGDIKHPTTWLALAAGWSGGSLASRAPTPPYMTSRAVRVAVLTSVPRIARPERDARLRDCITAGIKLAEEGLE